MRCFGCYFTCPSPDITTIEAKFEGDVLLIVLPILNKVSIYVLVRLLALAFLKNFTKLDMILLETDYHGVFCKNGVL